MWVRNIFVGQGPRALPWVQGKNPPVTASPCQPPLGKGAKRTGVAAIRFPRRTFIRFLYYRISRRAAPGQFINKPKEGIFYARLCYHDR